MVNGRSDKRIRIASYAQAYNEDYGFEAIMVAARQRLALELLRRVRPTVVVEIGCGSDLLVDVAADAGISFVQWIIVEPNEEFALLAQGAKQRRSQVVVVEGFVEDVVDHVHTACVKPPDLALCSGVLGEVPDVPAVLGAARSLVGEGGLIHVSVANARSLHRQLARAMGLMRDERELGPRNQALMQYRVFDAETLRDALIAAGIEIEESGGYFLKPFTHAQMADLQSSLLTPEMLAGLWTLGRELPEIASEIYVNCRAVRGR